LTHFWLSERISWQNFCILHCCDLSNVNEILTIIVLQSFFQIRESLARQSRQPSDIFQSLLTHRHCEAAAAVTVAPRRESIGECAAVIDRPPSQPESSPSQLLMSLLYFRSVCLLKSPLSSRLCAIIIACGKIYVDARAVDNDFEECPDLESLTDNVLR